MEENQGETRRLYNEEAKRAYLSSMQEEDRRIRKEKSVASYMRIFLKTKAFEEEQGKDLRDFTLEEIEPIFHAFEANNRNTIESYARIISSYLNWCERKGYIEKNPLVLLRPEDFERYLINRETYLTDQQVKEWEKDFLNMQDYICVLALFEGIGGKAFSELRNLKREHIDWDRNRLHLFESLTEDREGIPIRYTDRWLDVSPELMRVIRRCINEKIYHKRIRKAELPDNVRSYTDLVQNDYVLRASITKNDSGKIPVNRHVIHRRIDLLEEIAGLKGITPKLITRSGQLHYANTLIGESEELTLNEIKMTAARFNMASYHNLKGFLTIENIRKVYPVS